VERAMKAHAMPAHALWSAFAAACSHAGSAVAGRLARLPAVATPPLESVPLASIGPNRSKLLCRFGMAMARNDNSRNETACRCRLANNEFSYF